MANVIADDDVPGEAPSNARYDPETGTIKVRMPPSEVSDMLVTELKKQRKKKKESHQDSMLTRKKALPMQKSVRPFL